MHTHVPGRVTCSTPPGADVRDEAGGREQAMSCFHFSLTDNPGIDHFSLPGNARVPVSSPTSVVRDQPAGSGPLGPGRSHRLPSCRKLCMSW